MNSVRSFIESGKQDVVEVDIPDAIAGLFKPNELGVERLTEEDLVGIEPEGAAGGDTPNREVRRVVGSV